MHDARALPNERLVPQTLDQDLPRGFVSTPFGIRLRAAVSLGRSVFPWAKEAVFAEGVEVVHHRWHHHRLVCPCVDSFGLEHPEAEAAETGVAGCRVRSMTYSRVVEALPAHYREGQGDSVRFGGG